MSIKIAGLWELGWNSPIKEVELWEYPLKDFGVSELHMTPITGIKNDFVKEYSNIEKLLEENKGYTRVFCDERATTALKDFKHPKKAIYVFGKANYSPILNFKRSRDLSVKIETIENKGMLWPHQAAGIILHDRLMKKNGKK